MRWFGSKRRIRELEIDNRDLQFRLERAERVAKRNRELSDHVYRNQFLPARERADHVSGLLLEAQDQIKTLRHELADAGEHIGQAEAKLRREREFALTQIRALQSDVDTAEAALRRYGVT